MRARRTAWLRALLIAFALGAAAAGLTEGFVAAPLVFVAALWLLKPKRQTLFSPEPHVTRPVQRPRQGQGGRTDARRQRPSGPTPRDAASSATGTAVVCKQVTPERQEWVSSRTGRLYDVLSANGVPGAQPGDRGRVRLASTGWRIVPEPGPPQKAPSPDLHDQA